MNPDEQKRQEIAAKIAAYQDAYTNLIRIGVVLIESEHQDLSGLKETIDGLGGVEAKEILLVAAATAAHENVEMRRGAKLN